MEIAASLAKGIPNPDAEHLGGGVFESGDFVETLVVQGVVDVGEVVSEGLKGFGGDFNGEAVSVHGVAFVVWGQFGKGVGRFESKSDAVGEVGLFGFTDDFRVKGTRAANRDTHFGERRDEGRCLLEYPVLKILDGGLSDPVEVVQGLVIDSAVYRLEGVGYVGVVHDPIEIGVEFACDDEVQGVAVAVQTGFFAAVRGAMGGFELERFYQVEAGHPDIVTNRCKTY